MYNFEKKRKGKPLSKEVLRKIYKNDYRCKKKKFKQVNLKIRYDTYGDVIQKLSEQENVVQYVIDLVKKDISK